MTERGEKLRIAINGGGLAGALMFHSLLKHQHLDVHIFERAEAFKEAGAAITITTNALNALDLFESTSAMQCLERAGSVPHLQALIRLAQGPDAGRLVSEKADSNRLSSIVSRAAFLHELLVDAPSEQMHASKTLQDIHILDDSGSMYIQFTDGTKHECDIIIGADGIHSRVRKIFLGDGDPAASPVPAGWWAIQTLKPYADMHDKLTQDLVDVDDPRELVWLGDRSFFYTTLLSEGKQVQLVLVGCHDKNQISSDSDGWQAKISADEIRHLYKDWPSHISKAVHELLGDEESLDALYLWEHSHARTYVSGGVCVVGDAAHAMTPWQGSGGGMSVEDALILSTLLGRADNSLARARAALQIYDDLRRKRTQKIVDLSHGTGLIFTNQDPEVGQDAKKVGARLKDRWDLITDFDVGGHKDDAIRMMKEWET